MTRTEFMKNLKEALGALPQAERKKALAFYGEMLDDRIEESGSEAAGVASMEAPGMIAARLLREAPSPVRGSGSWGRTVLLALGSPIWLSLMIAAGAIVFSLYAAVWALLISLWAVLIALVVSVPALLLAGFFTGGMPNFLLGLGGALVFFGLSVLLYQSALGLTRGAIRMSSLLFRKIKNRRKPV